jgi:hypothetical protein
VHADEWLRPDSSSTRVAWTSWRSSRKPSQPKAWPADNPRVTFHFTPIGSSWMNQIEIWFGIITRQAVRRGTFGSVKVQVRRSSRTSGNLWTTTNAK